MCSLQENTNDNKKRPLNRICLSFCFISDTQRYNYYCLVKLSKQSTVRRQRFVIVLVHALICAVLFITKDEQRRSICWSFCVCSIEKEEDEAWFLWFPPNIYVVNALTDERKRLSTQILQLLRIVTSLCLFFSVCMYIYM